MALATSQKRATVFGDLRILCGTVALSDTAAVLDISLSKIIAAFVSSAGTIGGNSEVQVIINSDDGTEDTLAGSLWIDAAAAQNGNYLIIGY